MAEPSHNYTRLPGKLRDEIGISKAEYDGARKSRNGPGRRKEQRKAARVEKKTRHVPFKRLADIRREKLEAVGGKVLAVATEQRSVKATSIQPKAPKSILKARKAQPIPSPPSSSPPKIARRVKDKLAEDDAEIAALEKALGVKNKSKLPKSFEEDGLDDLLDGLNDVDVSDPHSGKRKRTESQDWLENKRRKAQVPMEGEESADSEELEDEAVTGSLGEDEDGEENDEAIFDLTDEDNEAAVFELEDADEILDGTSEEGDESESTPAMPTKRPRENPYVAPVTASTASAFGKYVPPSLRAKASGQTEDLSRLRKQTQGLLNRLSEANMLSIVGEVEKLYQSNPRQHVSATLLDVLLGLLSDPSSLQDTFIILHAGFIAALYKVIGTEFGAQAVQRIDEDFAQHYEKHEDRSGVDKRLVNLTNLFAELYNFQVIGSNLIYDLVRLFLGELSETNTELLLKIVRNAGPQLRQDDPSSLKAIAVLLQEQVAKAGETTVSTKIKFMMETMNNLRKNRMKTGVAASTISSEHTIRMKKTLGSMNEKTTKASEPLQISLKDLRESDRRGKWWFIGSSYRDEDQDNSKMLVLNRQDKHHGGDGLSLGDGTNGDLVQLAKEQRMNTDVRRSIFVAIMSATDYNDAYVRLMKLRLKKSQELEIPKVLIHCSGAEAGYNQFYTLLSRRVCSDRKLKMAFQFSLWDLFKQMGEGDDEAEDDENDEASRLGLRAVVNLARMFGGLIADGGLGLGVLKVSHPKHAFFHFAHC